MHASNEVSLVPLGRDRQSHVCVVREVDPDSERDTAWAAELHRELFADIGLIAQLGQRVLQRFCYGRLVKDRLMRAALAVVDDKPAGLIAWTKDSRAVHRAALGSHLGAALREIVLATIIAPRILLGMPGAARLLAERRNENSAGGRPVAEVLALGVREEYRNRQFLRETGVRLSDSLLHRALTMLVADGVTEGRGVILAANKPAIAFSSLRAKRVIPYHNAAHPSVEIWYDIPEALAMMEHRMTRGRSGTLSAAGPEPDLSG